MKNTQYSNPRIDREEPIGSADACQVYLDPSKVVWVGSMLLVGTVGSALTISIDAVLLFMSFTAVTLCFGPRQP